MPAFALRSGFSFKEGFSLGESDTVVLGSFLIQFYNRKIFMLRSNVLEDCLEPHDIMDRLIYI
jgi:hypothetical protein